jgi:hypothetical protein
MRSLRRFAFAVTLAQATGVALMLGRGKLALTTTLGVYCHMTIQQAAAQASSNIALIK